MPDPNEYTPKPEDVRHEYVVYRDDLGEEEAGARFDRMLAEVARVAEVNALRAAAQSVEDTARQGGGLQTAAAALHREADRIGASQ